MGVAVLLGTTEQTLVTLTLGAATRFNNGTRKVAPAVLLSVDSRLSRSDRDGGVNTPKAVTLKEHEAMLTLRVLVDRSVLDAFAMGGRGSMTRRVYPQQFNSSLGAALIYHVPKLLPETTAEDAAAGVHLSPPPPEPPLVTVTVWEMSSGFVKT